MRKLPPLRRLALGSGEPPEVELVGSDPGTAVIQDEMLWACTTCRACERACPVFVEQVGEIVAMRRYLTLEEGRLPDTLAGALRNTGRQGNPWGQPRHQRAKVSPLLQHFPQRVPAVRWRLGRRPSQPVHPGSAQ